jgi:MFS family permease
VGVSLLALWGQVLAVCSNRAGYLAAGGQSDPWGSINATLDLTKMPRPPREIAAVALGVGTAFVDPTLLAAIGDVAHPSWRASAVGVYRIWRDGGYAIGALIAGITADVVGLRGAILTIAALTAASGLIAARLLTETHTVGETTMARTKVSHPLFARFYAWASPRMEKAGYGERRGQLLAGLTGRVLEVGAYNGMNFTHYPAEVTAVLAVEPEPHLSLPRSPRSVVSEAWRRAAVLRARPGRYPRLGRVQRVLDATVWPTVGAGCHAHRDTTMKEG